MSIKFDNNIPIYVQLVEYLKNCIISNKYKLGERLPSVRDLAIEMKVNPNTIQRTLVDLESMKLIHTESTNGRYVTNDVKLIEKYKKEKANKLTREYLNNMIDIGLTIEDIKKIIGGKQWNY